MNTVAITPPKGLTFKATPEYYELALENYPEYKVHLPTNIENAEHRINLACENNNFAIVWRMLRGELSRKWSDAIGQFSIAESRSYTPEVKEILLTSLRILAVVGFDCELPDNGIVSKLYAQRIHDTKYRIELYKRYINVLYPYASFDSLEDEKILLDMPVHIVDFEPTVRLTNWLEELKVI